jgi:hypothetical protein
MAHQHPFVVAAFTKPVDVSALRAALLTAPATAA